MAKNKMSYYQAENMFTKFRAAFNEISSVIYMKEYSKEMIEPSKCCFRFQVLLRYDLLVNSAIINFSKEYKSQLFALGKNFMGFSPEINNDGSIGWFFVDIKESR